MVECSFVSRGLVRPLGKKSIHVVASVKENILRVITVYEPNELIRKLDRKKEEREIV